ncbi:MAG: hypothetical protein SF339_00110 [Blastocatellia bacterium]|nr:hypothetical protein [Blastocatellia bacterium]
MALFPCPYLGCDVELTEEREMHIAEQHPDLLPQYRDALAETLAAPDSIRRSERFGNARMFTRWFDTVRDGKYVVVVVVTDPAPAQRHWIITAYIARKLAGGVTEWTRS